MSRANLMLHAGANKVEREQLELVETPQRTASWVPIPHHTLLNGIQDTLQHAGLTVVSEAHGLTKDGARYFGLLQVVNGHADSDFGLVVGLRNSHDKMFPAGLVVGASVFVCDNLSFSGEIKLARKHTAHVERDLPMLIERAVGKLGDMRHTQETRFLGYKQHELTDSHAHDLIIAALDAQVMPVTRIPDVLQEWRNPRHSEFAANGKTAWRLFQAMTEVLKGNIDALPRRTQALHGLLDVACGLIAAQPQIAQAV